VRPRILANAFSDKLHICSNLVALERQRREEDSARVPLRFGDLRVERVGRAPRGDLGFDGRLVGPSPALDEPQCLHGRFRHHPLRVALAGLRGLRAHPPVDLRRRPVTRRNRVDWHAVAGTRLHEGELVVAAARDAGHRDVAGGAQFEHGLGERPPPFRPPLLLQVAALRRADRAAGGVAAPRDVVDAVAQIEQPVASLDGRPGVLEECREVLIGHQRRCAAAMSCPWT
jgi:hypothetical protein